MRLHRPKERLREDEVPVPEPGIRQVVVKVEACAVCRTDLHIVDGDLTRPNLPLIPGHEIVGRVHALGADTKGFRLGDRVGIPWLGYTCGTCDFCAGGQENLCGQAGFTGYDFDGGYAEYAVADSRYVFALSRDLQPVQAAPLLCAGVIGYRSYGMTGTSQRIGIYGFGAAAHLVSQVARHDGREIYAFVRRGDRQGLQFAEDLGVKWAGYAGDTPPCELDAAIIFAPAGEIVPESLRVIRKGGVVVCGGIHMTDIPTFPYSRLWGERSVRSVANLTRQDALSFLQLAAEIPIRTVVHPFPLSRANEALEALRSGPLSGAAVLIPDDRLET